MYTPSKVFFTKGVGQHPERIGSLEMALRDAGIEKYNIAEVSSIVPPDASIIGLDEGTRSLSLGQVVHAVVSESATRKDDKVGASIGFARGPKGHGYLIEATEEKDEAENVGERAEALAVELLDRNEYESSEVTQTAEGEEGVWTTVFSGAVLVP